MTGCFCSRSNYARGNNSRMLCWQERADEDAQNVEYLRQKWRASEQETHHWLQDVQESLMKWSYQRARTEEEIIRRQEASRYTMPYAPVVSNPNQDQYPDGV